MSNAPLETVILQRADKLVFCLHDADPNKGEMFRVNCADLPDEIFVETQRIVKLLSTPPIDLPPKDMQEFMNNLGAHLGTHISFFVTENIAGVESLKLVFDERRRGENDLCVDLKTAVLPYAKPTGQLDML